MTDSVLLDKDKRRVLILTDPRFYFTIALFAGESSPVPGLSSGWLYFFSVIGFLCLFIHRRFIVRKSANIVLIIYFYIVFRNLTSDFYLINIYLLPNMVTGFLFFIISTFYYSEDDLETFGNYIFLFSCIMAFLGIIKFIINPFERLAVFGGPNGYYKIVLLFHSLCFFKYYNNKNILSLLGMLLGILLCFATGSKGGILTLFGIIILEIWYYLFNKNTKNKSSFLRFLVVGIIVLVGAYAFEFIINSSLSFNLIRAVSFLDNSNQVSELTSVSSRMAMFALSIELFQEFPIFGVGGDGLLVYSNYAYPYSHNIFLEFLCEQGLVGTFLLVLFLLRLIHLSLNSFLMDSQFFVLMLSFCVYFFGSLFSGNILDSKTVFLFGLLMIIHCSNKHLHNPGR